MCFPLAICRSSVSGVLDAPDEGSVTAEVVGYTTQKTYEAGASSLRLKVHEDTVGLSLGHSLVAVKASGCAGFLPGIAAPRCGGGQADDAEFGLEVVIFGRPDLAWSGLMYLPEDVNKRLFTLDSAVEVRFVKHLGQVQHDCPPQWLRDLLLRLADRVQTAFTGERDSVAELQLAVWRAGLVPRNEKVEQELVAPADRGNRVGEDELGYWNEEMMLNTRCGASAEGGRLDGHDRHGLLPSFPGIEAML